MNYTKYTMRPLPTLPTPPHQHSHEAYKYGQNHIAHENTTHRTDGANKRKKYHKYKNQNYN
jgi:hypothetical protein